EKMTHTDPRLNCQRTRKEQDRVLVLFENEAWRSTMTHIQLTGRFRAVRKDWKTTCWFLPDFPGECLSIREGTELLLIFPDDFREIMRQHQVPLRLGTAELFNDPCLVDGTIREGEPAHSGQFIINDIVAFEVVTSTFSYNPDRIYSVSYAFWFDG